MPRQLYTECVDHPQECVGGRKSTRLSGGGDGDSRLRRGGVREMEMQDGAVRGTLHLPPEWQEDTVRPPSSLSQF